MVRGVLEAHGYEEPVFIGEGSFAKVYRVKDKEGCFWACRVSEYSGQWERECKNWQEIRHPLFPVYREHWTQDGMGYLIIEFWNGMDLQKMLDRRGRLSPVTALNVTLGAEKAHLKISGKDRRREKWLRRIVEMTTCEERKRRVPDIKHLRRLLLVTDVGVRERRWAAKAADFYYIRKLHYP